MKTDKKRFKVLKGFPLKVFVVLLGAALTFGLYQGWRHMKRPAQLIERQDSIDRKEGSDDTPSPATFNKMLPEVLKRKDETRDSSAELPVINGYIKSIDDKFGTVSNVFIENYLGSYQVRITISVSGNVAISDLHTFAVDTLKPCLELSKEFSRVSVSIEAGATPLEHFYIPREKGGVEVYDLDYSIDHKLMSMSASDNGITKDISKLISKSILKTTATVIALEEDTQNTVRVTLDTTASDRPTNDCVDSIDLIFQYCNELNKQTYIQVYNGERLQFSARVIPNSPTFKAFYTSKKYYQDIARAEYYLCNGWLYNESLTTLNTLVDNLI